MEEIIVDKLTKDYGKGRGIFDVSFEVKKGEVFGFLGPNGAGKSTTMRHLMGFSKPQGGKAMIQGMDCFKQHDTIMNQVGYLPGEVALLEGVNGKEFLHIMQGLRKTKDQSRMEELLKRFSVNLEGDVRKLSIGEKRKLAVVTAFMNDPDVLLLDEPTSGLDPMMQEVFISFVKEEKERGKTVLLSSHIFHEVEALCDRIAIIKEGKIIAVVNAEEVSHFKRKTFDLTFETVEDYTNFQTEQFEVRKMDLVNHKLSIVAPDNQINQLLETMGNYNVTRFIEQKQTLEDYFMHFYKNTKKFGGIENERSHLRKPSYQGL